MRMYEAEVQKGIDLFESNGIDWANKIDPKTIEIFSNEFCPLAQAMGWATGLEAMRVALGGVDYVSHYLSVFGFNLKGTATEDRGMVMTGTDTDLIAEWRRRINQARGNAA